MQPNSINDSKERTIKLNDNNQPLCLNVIISNEENNEMRIIFNVLLLLVLIIGKKDIFYIY